MSLNSGTRAAQCAKYFKKGISLACLTIFGGVRNDEWISVMECSIVQLSQVDAWMEITLLFLTDIKLCDWNLQIVSADTKKNMLSFALVYETWKNKEYVMCRFERVIALKEYVRTFKVVKMLIFEKRYNAEQPSRSRNITMRNWFLCTGVNNQE